jgi:hypothetical protein
MDHGAHALKPMRKKGNSPLERVLDLIDHGSGSWEISVVREISCLGILKLGFILPNQDIVLS